MDEGDFLLSLLMSIHPIARIVIEWVSFASTIIIGFITLSPWKGDDATLENIKKMPIIGKLVAALLKFSPLSFIKKDK